MHKPQTTITSTRLTEDSAIRIYQAKTMNLATRDLAFKLSQVYAVTVRTIFDIWNLRSWCSTTEPYWTKDDQFRIKSRFCKSCMALKIYRMQDACKECRNRSKRGIRYDRPHETDVKTKTEDLPVTFFEYDLDYSAMKNRFLYQFEGPMNETCKLGIWVTHLNDKPDYACFFRNVGENENDLGCTL